MTKLLSQVVILAGLGAAGGMALTGQEPARLLAEASSGTECSIKGNISIDSGERIYHVPGQKYYGPTKIDPEFGERWFCSEGEARAAGWRKSRV
jgi:hypothetical protein